VVSSAMSVGGMEAPKSASGDKPYPWIISPLIDFFFICGGGALIFFVVNYMYLGWTVPTDLNNPAAYWLITVGFLSQHLFADSHNSATYLRIWGSPEDQARFKFHRTWLAYSTIPMFILGLSLPGTVGVFVYIYLITVYWHYVAQAFGISLIYCYKRGYYFTNMEKEIYRWFMFSMVGWTTAGFLTFRDRSPRNWFGVEIPFWGPLPDVVYNSCRFLFFFMTIAFVVVLLRKYLRDNQMMPWQGFLIIFTVGCLGLSRDVANTMFWLYVPGFFHGSQYLAVCLAYYLKERGMPEGMNTWEIAKVATGAPGMKYLGLVILSGVFFYVGIPHFFMQIGFPFAMMGGLVLACVNYHHFITDAAIWRLKDPRCRKILLA
jgi:hypothetical protein